MSTPSTFAEASASTGSRTLSNSRRPATPTFSLGDTMSQTPPVLRANWAMKRCWLAIPMPRTWTRLRLMAPGLYGENLQPAHYKMPEFLEGSCSGRRG